MNDPTTSPARWHGTTILTVRKSGKVVIAGDGQVSLGATVIKANAGANLVGTAAVEIDAGLDLGLLGGALDAGLPLHGG